MIALAYPKSAVAEAYRVVWTNLQFAKLDLSKRSIQVTSAGPREGKSTTVANLGVTMAMAGLRTLLVDSDLRKPTLHKLFGLPNTAGLTTVLADEAPPEEGILSTRLPGLFILPSGPIPPNPAEVLASRRMGEFIELAKVRFDFVLYDSPPVLPASDSLILASLAEGVILVVKCGGFPYKMIRQAKEKLEGVKANLLGILLNSVDLKRHGYHYQYYYSQYYGYGSQNGAK